MITMLLQQLADILFLTDYTALIGWQSDLVIVLACVVAVGFLWLLYRFVRGLFGFLRWW